jgi:hypothetical protein
MKAAAREPPHAVAILDVGLEQALRPAAGADVARELAHGLLHGRGRGALEVVAVVAARALDVELRGGGGRLLLADSAGEDEARRRGAGRGGGGRARTGGGGGGDRAANAGDEGGRGRADGRGDCRCVG